MYPWKVFSFTSGTFNFKQLVTGNIVPVDLLALKACFIGEGKQKNVGQISFSTTYLNSNCTGVRQIKSVTYKKSRM